MANDELGSDNLFAPEFVMRLIDADEEAWKKLVDEMHPNLVRHLIWRFGVDWRADTAEDIVQDVWRAVVQAIVGRSRLSAGYFYAAVDREARRVIRRETRRRTVSLDEPCGEDGTLTDMFGQLCRRLTAVDDDDLWRALERLNEEEKSVVMRIYFQGATVAEVAQELGKTVDQVRYVKEQALEKLKRFLQALREAPGQ